MSGDADTEQASGAAALMANLHAVEARSRANGPGVRTVVWFQGCDLGCPGCFNPETHERGGRRRVAVSTLVDEIAELAADGVTLSGGEPMQQPEAVLALLTGLRARRDLSLLMFSGYRLAEIQAMALGPAVLAQLDVLVDGRYVAPLRRGRELRGSRNQEVHLLSDRHQAGDIAATPVAEVRISPDGIVTLTGVDPLRLA
jgi:anaerobic ribonucleoside-triphosphate reductase activating protein